MNQATTAGRGLAFYLTRRIRSLQARQKQQPDNEKVARLLKQSQEWKRWVLRKKRGEP